MINGLFFRFFLDLSRKTYLQSSSPGRKFCLVICFLARLVTGFFAINLWFPAFAQGTEVKKTEIKKIEEIEQISDVLKYADKPLGTVVIFGVDNALLTSDYHMANRNWFYHRIDTHIKKGLLEPEAIDRALSEWTAVLNLTPQKLVDPETPRVVDELKKKKVRVLGITSRGLGLASKTIEHLKSLGVMLSAQNQADIPITMGEKLLLFRGGVLFTSGTHKIMALKKLYDVFLTSEPEKIIMVSHSENTLTMAMEGMRLHSKKSQFIPLRLKKMDLMESKFQPNIGDIQFSQFGKLLSNEEAAKMLLMEEKR